ncbi:MAG: hypothetical protein R3F13_12235 [Prosthecobacter sp.]
MNPNSSNATLSGPETSSLSPDSFARDLAALVDDLERTKKWFNAQLDAQLSGLKELRATFQPESEAIVELPPVMSEAPHLVAPTEPNPPSPPTPGNAAHPTIILPPSKVTALHPDLEQATLRELNDALSSAFAEISSRGGMLI